MFNASANCESFSELPKDNSYRFLEYIATFAMSSATLSDVFHRESGAGDRGRSRRQAEKKEEIGKRGRVCKRREASAVGRACGRAEHKLAD